MGCDETEKFYMVARSYTLPGIPCDYLQGPTKAVYHKIEDAEKEAVRLALLSGKNFTILESIAHVHIDDNGVPRWEEVSDIK